MKDLSRLLDDTQTDPLEADLLRLARGEGPTGEGRRRILAGLGVAAAVSAVATNSAASAAAAPLAMPPVATTSAALKWFAVGTVAAGASVAGFLLWHHGAAPKSASPQLAAATVPASPPASPDTGNVSATPAAPQAVTRLEDLPTLPAATPDAHAASTPSLAEEVAAIKSAKTALAAGDPSQALHELDAYRAHFPHGRLVQEAAVVRIEALVRAGNTAAANAAADRFLAGNEGSPYAARVRSLVGR